MLKSIKLNLEEVEAMLFFWHATADREKVSEAYLAEVASMPGLNAAYDEEFNAESVRKVLSAITNRERLSATTKKESRFWTNNMWMLEDLGYTDMMVAPLKKLNIDHLTEEINHEISAFPFEEVEIIFSPLHFDEYLIRGNKLIINFFKVVPAEEGATISGQEVTLFIKDKIKEMMIS